MFKTSTDSFREYVAVFSFFYLIILCALLLFILKALSPVSEQHEVCWAQLQRAVSGASMDTVPHDSPILMANIVTFLSFQHIPLFYPAETWIQSHPQDRTRSGPVPCTSTPATVPQRTALLSTRMHVLRQEHLSHQTRLLTPRSEPAFMKPLQHTQGAGYHNIWYHNTQLCNILQCMYNAEFWNSKMLKVDGSCTEKKQLTKIIVLFILCRL